MKYKHDSLEQQPLIVKYTEAHPSGVQSQVLSRYAVGFLVRGEKHFYRGDRRHTIRRGDIYFLGLGPHYIENQPEERLPFEEIIFYYTPEELQRILVHLNLTYGLHIPNKHACVVCRNENTLTMKAWGALRTFFNNTNSYLQDAEFCHDETAKNIKMTELIYLLISHEECCIKSKVLQCVDHEQESFEQIIYDHIFKEISIEELARLNHRSLTAFKKEFHRHFLTPPHRWFIHQRLLHARLLLTATSKSISEIGHECAFPNTSHFIKLFKKVYCTTPASYRQQHGTLAKEAWLEEEQALSS